MGKENAVKNNLDKGKLNKANEVASQDTDSKAKQKSEALLAEGSEAGIERYARDKERATRQAIAKSPMVPVWIDPVTGKDGEVLTYRLNGVTYHIKTKQVVEVPEALAMVIYDQSRRKKLSVKSMVEYAAGMGKGLGELK